MAFHPYPQLIPQVFNPGGFGPPRPLTAASPWPWVDHSASGPHPATNMPTPKVSCALFGLAFATATPPGLTSPHATNSQAHSSKGTPSRPACNHADDAPTDCRHTVSGTLSLPSRGTFHPSLTVLVHYRSPGSIQPYQVVLADSHGISRAPRYSGTAATVRSMSSTGLSPTTVGHSHAVRLHHAFLTVLLAGRPERHVPQPHMRNPCRVSHAHGLG